MSTFLPAEKGTTIRQPSTANLMIDSQDGPKEASGFLRLNPWNFQITRTQSILNGFFTRIGTTEVVLEWNYPNISADASNNFLVFDISGNPTTYTMVFDDGFYNVAQLLDQMSALMEIVSPTTMEVIDISGAPISLEFGGGTDYVSFHASNLAFALGLAGKVGAASPLSLKYFLVNVDLRPYRYLDFVSQQLTYNQDIKDTSTAVFNRDVLCRWYMSWDNSPDFDAYGFPILMGYAPFNARRLYNPPKQIRWDNIQPVGNLSFQVYGNDGKIVPNIPFDAKSNWLMTLQVSEV